MYKVLLAEDEVRIRQGLKKLIEQVAEGFKVSYEANNGEEALAYLRTSLPHLIVTDVRMPKMNGIEFIRQVRGILPDIPILIISGHREFEYAKMAMQYGVENYILKPIDPVELTHFLLAIKEQFQKKHLDRDSHLLPDHDSQNYRQVIRRVKELVHEQAGDDLSLKRIADQIYLNHQYLSHLFKTETGQLFSDYVTKVRMKKAQQLLRETNLRVYEIANVCGYSSAKYFMTLFKKTLGMTPSEYREQK